MSEVEKTQSKFYDSKYDSLGSDNDDQSNIEGSVNMGGAKSISITKVGFNLLDEFTFKILLEFIKKRIEIITSKKDAILKRKTGKNLINLIGEVMKVSTLTQ